MKLQKYYAIFVYILQDKMGKTGKNAKKTRNWSDQKPKIWDERNNSVYLW